MQVTYKTDSKLNLYSKYLSLLDQLSRILRMPKLVGYVNHIPSIIMTRRKPTLELKEVTHSKEVSEDTIKNLKDYGFAFNVFDEFSQRAVKICDKFISKPESWLEFTDASKGKKYFRNIYGTKQVADFPEILNLMEDINLRTQIQKIAGTCELAAAGIYLSEKCEDNSRPIGSQQYHYDESSLRHIKLFINLEDTNEDNGPFTFFDKKTSNFLVRWSFYSFVKRFFYRNAKYSIKNLFRVNRVIVPHSDLTLIKVLKNSIKATGKRGTNLLVNTAQCLHKGSDVKKGRRLVLMVHFTTNINYVVRKSDCETLALRSRDGVTLG